jgi:hypothetical protein
VIHGPRKNLWLLTSAYFLFFIRNFIRNVIGSYRWGLQQSAEVITMLAEVLAKVSRS